MFEKNSTEIPRKIIFKVMKVKDKSKSREKSGSFATLAMMILLPIIGFFIGKINFAKPEIKVIETEISREIPTVVLKNRSGDEIFAEISGDVKITWADNYVLEESGLIYFGQIPTEDDLKLNDFKYLANAKTKKFYPAKSYPARGTEVRYRRFFQTKEEAISAGFIASKLVK